MIGGSDSTLTRSRCVIGGSFLRRGEARDQVCHQAGRQEPGERAEHRAPAQRGARGRGGGQRRATLYYLQYPHRTCIRGIKQFIGLFAVRSHMKSCHRLSMLLSTFLGFLYFTRRVLHHLEVFSAEDVHSNRRKLTAFSVCSGFGGHPALARKHIVISFSSTLDLGDSDSGVGAGQGHGRA